MPAANFEFKSTGDLFQALVNNQKLSFSGGKASKNLPSNLDHSLTWFVRGAPGSTYRLAITAPNSAKWETTGTLDSSTKDAGIHWFRVE
jgi:hypothetical protein